MLNNLAVGIITFNEENKIGKCLEKCIKLTNNIVVVDSFSDDNTLKICEKYNCQIYKNKFDNYSEQRNFLISKILSEWILIVDADEILSDNLILEIKDLIKMNKNYNYKIYRRIFFKDYLLKYCVNNYEIRLFKKKNFIKYQNIVHEKIILKKGIKNIKLKNYIIHYSYDSVLHHIKKMIKYARLKNKSNRRFIIVLLICLYNFNKFFILKLGFLDGIHGLYFSLIHTLYVFLQYYK